MSFLERYRSGEHEQVWIELQALGAEVRGDQYQSEAVAVVAETMHRVRRNCERLVERLSALGYRFDLYPDGSPRRDRGGPLEPPAEDLQAQLTELEDTAGTLPMSLVGFWSEVGSVDLGGMHPAWPDGLDPLIVDPPEAALAFLYHEHGDDGEDSFFAALAPDDIHKDNVSGGDPYGLRLPHAAADFPFVDGRDDPLFVHYLRFSILQWGGLPGLTRRTERLEALNGLVADLEPF